MRSGGIVNNLKKFVVMRHGQEAYGELTTKSAEDVEWLAGRLKEIIGSLSFAIITSTAPRAIATQKVISNVLTHASTDQVILNPDLWIAYDSPGNGGPWDTITITRKAWSGIARASDNAEVIIVITHADLILELLEFAYSQLRWSSPPKKRTFAAGEAIVLDNETETAEYITPQK